MVRVRCVYSLRRIAIRDPCRVSTTSEDSLCPQTSRTGRKPKRPNLVDLWESPGPSRTGRVGTTAWRAWGSSLPPSLLVLWRHCLRPVSLLTSGRSTDGTRRRYRDRARESVLCCPDEVFPMLMKTAHAGWVSSFRLYGTAKTAGVLRSSFLLRCEFDCVTFKRIF